MTKRHNISPDNSHSETDDQMLRQLLKRHSLQAPPSPWFTRKVMNRLPERRRRTAALIEYAVYLIAALATVIMGVVYLKDVIGTGVVTIGNLTVLATYLAVFLAVIFLTVSPWLRGDDI